ncbi:MAG: hypothetical protein VB144_05025 [Clostridia bacterium]|nr:hypothetical protein [Clostridia bacterium]
MRVLRYTVTLVQPVILSSLGGDPNSSVTYNFIPGTVLRGAAIWAYLRRNGSTDLDATDPVVQRVFFGRTTRYLNGYIVDKSGRRALPMPLSWRVRKHTSQPVFDLAVTEPEDDMSERPKASFCAPDRRDALLVSPQTELAIHLARDRAAGRPVRGSGAVFRYEALSPGQVFEAAVVCDEDADADVIRGLLNGESHLGRSRTAGYGRVTWELIGDSEEWQEVPEADSRIVPLKPNSTATITLLSDALLRNEYGQSCADARSIAAATAEALGLAQAPMVDKAFVRMRWIGGFNRKWGLPTQQEAAVMMGSVVQLRFRENVDADRLLALEERGLGERVSGGFGRLAINWHEEPSYERSYGFGPYVVDSRVPEFDGASERIAKKMVERILRSKLDAAVTIAAVCLMQESGVGVRPPNSQLQQVRSIVLNCIELPPDQGTARLNEFLEHIEARTSASRAFSRGMIGGGPWLKWLKYRVNHPAEIWIAIGAAESTDSVPAIGPVDPARIAGTLQYEYNLRFVESVIGLAVRSSREVSR